MLLIFGTSQSEHFSCGTQSIEQDYPGCFSVFSLSGVGLILYFGLIFCLKYFLFKGYETWIGSSRPELFSGIDLSVCVLFIRAKALFHWSILTVLTESKELKLNQRVHFVSGVLKTSSETNI